MSTKIQINIENATEAATALGAILAQPHRRAILEAAAEEVTVGAREHFAARETEPRKNSGFPAFGKAFPKKYFWSGTRGNSVAEKIQPPVIDISAGTATIAIDSPALAHKANPNPPPITPKGGRKYLAIPASVRAACYTGMPRTFDPGGGLTFAYSRTPEGRWMPALVARQHNQRSLSRGSRAGQRVAASLEKATSGQGEPHYWLVKQVQTRHDPNAMPDRPALEKRANARVLKTIELLTSKAN